MRYERIGAETEREAYLRVQRQFLDDLSRNILLLQAGITSDSVGAEEAMALGSLVLCCGLRSIAHSLAAIEERLSEQSYQAKASGDELTHSLDLLTEQAISSTEWINKRLERIANELEAGRM